MSDPILLTMVPFHIQHSDPNQHMLSSVNVLAALSILEASPDVLGPLSFTDVFYNFAAFQEDGTVHKRGPRDKELLEGLGGRRLHCQAPAERVCITWVNKALAWDVLFNRGVAPQKKNADNSG